MLSDSRSGSDGHSGLDPRSGTPFQAAAFPKRRLVKGLPALTGSRGEPECSQGPGMSIFPHLEKR